MKSCCFVGHRNVFEKDLEEKLEKVVTEKAKKGYRTFYVGFHGDFDRLAIRCCAKLKSKGFDVEIFVVVTSFSEVEKLFDFSANSKGNIKTIMFDVEEVFWKNKILVSNKQMVDSCQMLVCYVDTNVLAFQSGAKKIFNYARKKGLEIINLYEEKNLKEDFIDKKHAI